MVIDKNDYSNIDCKMYLNYNADILHNADNVDNTDTSDNQLLVNTVPNVDMKIRSLLISFVEPLFSIVRQLASCFITRNTYRSTICRTKCVSQQGAICISFKLMAFQIITCMFPRVIEIVLNTYWGVIFGQFEVVVTCMFRTTKAITIGFGTGTTKDITIVLSSTTAQRVRPWVTWLSIVNRCRDQEQVISVVLLKTIHVQTWLVCFCMVDQ